MMGISAILQNVLLGLSIAAPVGPASVAILNSGIQGGFLPAFQVALGVILADVTFILVAYFGLASLIAIPLVKIIILFFGMAVLALLSYRTLREALSQAGGFTNSTRTAYKNKFLEGYAVNISNPMAVVWWLGLIGSILASSGQTARTLSALLLPFTVVLGIFLWHTGLSVVSHFSKKFLNITLLKYISIISALVLFFFALRFGYLALSLI